MTVLGIAALRDLSRLDNALPWRTMDEFADFYCAGWAIDQRADPYRYEPLHACEHRVNVGNGFRAGLFASNPPVAVPAPQPPFDFVPYAALARLPATQARIVDGVAIVAAVAVCAMALAALGVPLGLSLAALTLSVAYVELNTAQIVPFALLALVLGGLALARGRYVLAGILLTLSAIEPSAGLPGDRRDAALRTGRPRRRRCDGASSRARLDPVVGPAGVLDYVAKVLPGARRLRAALPVSIQPDVGSRVRWLDPILRANRGRAFVRSRLWFSGSFWRRERVRHWSGPSCSSFFPRSARSSPDRFFIRKSSASRFPPF